MIDPACAAPICPGAARPLAKLESTIACFPEPSLWCLLAPSTVFVEHVGTSLMSHCSLEFTESFRSQLSPHQLHRPEVRGGGPRGHGQRSPHVLADRGDRLQGPRRRPERPRLCNPGRRGGARERGGRVALGPGASPAERREAGGGPFACRHGVRGGRRACRRGGAGDGMGGGAPSREGAGSLPWAGQLQWALESRISVFPLPCQADHVGCATGAGMSEHPSSHILHVQDCAICGTLHGPEGVLQAIPATNTVAPPGRHTGWPLEDGPFQFVPNRFTRKQ